MSFEWIIGIGSLVAGFFLAIIFGRSSGGGLPAISPKMIADAVDAKAAAREAIDVARAGATDTKAAASIIQAETKALDQVIDAKKKAVAALPDAPLDPVERETITNDLGMKKEQW